ncbi:MAG: AAA family ATPase [Chloroflexi bacterium]|nr:AAA family ATPase [Chloroflexota bacterium]
MKRVLITGMSGTGKSTLICELAARGYRAVDTDSDEWSEWVTVPADSDRSDAGEESDWIWREDRIQRLLSSEDGDVLFVSGCKSNQGTFYPQFDHVVLLRAPVPVLMERLSTRTTNSYGKHPDERTRILGHVQSVEPLLRRTASREVDTSAPIEHVLETILSHVLDGEGTGEGGAIDDVPGSAGGETLQGARQEDRQTGGV